MTEPLPFKPEKPVEKGTDPGEKALKKLEKMEAETGLLGPADRYRLLCADSPRRRLELLDAALDDVVAMIEFRRT